MRDVKETIRVEIIVRNPKNVVFDGMEFLNKYLDGRKQGKTIYLVPTDWVGFKNGFLKDLMRSGLDVYVALAFSTTADDEVIDTNGEKVMPFIHRLPGGMIKKYVKKAFQIVTEGNNIFNVSLDLSKDCPVEISMVLGGVCRI